MKYNKEYIEQLLRRFMDGETTEQEEQFLTEYFSTNNSIPENWVAYRDMFASFATDAYDFTEEELSTFVKEETPKPRIVKMWPWFAAACVATLLIVFLAPPREETKQVAKVEKTITPQKEQKDSVKTEIVSQHMQEDKLLAQVSKSNPSTPQPELRRSRSKQQEYITEPKPSQDELANTDESIMDEDKLMAELSPQFKEMEMAFLSHSAPIRERGQQVIHKVSMLQQEQRSQQQFVEL